MIRYLDKISSLTNLRKDNAAGQIATVLILIITALLIFTLVVANIGQVSTYATNLANAADAASMYLASQIGTKAYSLSASLYNACGNPLKCCVKTGLLALILAIVLIIIAIIICIVSWGSAAEFLAWAVANAAYVIAGAAAIGAIGGAIGGAIAGTGAGRGALQGAMVGFAIGTAVVGGAYIGATYFGAGVGAISAGSATATAAMVGATLAVTLSVAANVYTAYVKDQMLGDAMASAVKALNGLPETLRRRESVMLQALSETIDDPNKVPDAVDSDGDGNTTELVPNFQVCWDRRITWIKSNMQLNETEQVRLVREFLRGAGSPMGRFLRAIDTFLEQLGRQGRGACDRVDAYGNCIFCGRDGYGNMACGSCRGNTIVEVFAALENAGYDISFWEPGPTAEEIEAWKNWDPFACNNCPPAAGGCGTPWDPINQCPACEPPDPPSGYDEVDYVIDELKEFKSLVSDLRTMDDFDLAYNWRLWMFWFYEPDSELEPGDVPADYYHAFLRMVNGDNASMPFRVGIRNWLTELEAIRQRLPICNYGCGVWDGYGNLVACNPAGTPCYNCIIKRIDPITGRPNPPCRWHPSNPNFGTTDICLDDEFAAARNAINAFINAVEAFRQASRALYESLAALSDPPIPPDSPMACGLTAGNPATYFWTDSRGDHSIGVALDNYQEPRLVERKYGNWLKGEKCIELDNYRQNITVRIVRTDPSTDMGIMGRWNPGAPVGRISRTSVAQYQGLKSYDDKCHPAGWVRIVGR